MKRGRVDAAAKHCSSPTPHPPPPLSSASICVHLWFLPLWLLCVAAGGCGYRSPEFRLNTEGPARSGTGRAQADEIAGILARLFGTPDEPRAPDDSGLRLERLRHAAGPAWMDERGMRYGLYRWYCAACHGIVGDGAGPAASVLDPYPRDFRPGVMKFTSTWGGAKAARSDLERMVRQGMPGTSMPSYAALADDEIDALVEYVYYLALRGETELYLFQRIVQEDDYIADVREVVEDAVEPFAARWAAAERSVVAPPPRPSPADAAGAAERVVRGREVYQADRAKCVSCHGPEGRGDGPQAMDLYDDWNRPKRGATPEQTRERARQFLLPIQRLRPRDFTSGVLKGGNRPIEVYWTLHVGIKGTPMPGVDPAPGTPGVLSPEEIWHLVDYILARGLPGSEGR
jgi:mono/diheme cytochrome c family protein